MKEVSRDDLKKIFKKVKHLRLPQKLSEIEFKNLYYFTWKDDSENICYLVTEKNNIIIGLRGNFNRMPTRRMKHLCSICQKQREFHEIMLFSTKTKKLPQGVNYRVLGTYMCTDYLNCNKEMKNDEQIQKFIDLVLSN